MPTTIEAPVAIAGTLWRVVSASGFSRGNPSVRALHVRRALDPEWLRSLPVPIGERRAADQKVSLLSPDGIERWLDDADVEAAYASRSRTRVYEDLGKLGGGWIEDVELLLATATGFSVGCSAYQSLAGDASFGAHVDRWIGVILQIKGSKRFLIRNGRTGPRQQLIIEAGDVLIMPPTVEHEVSTPESSLHVNFEIFTHLPLTR